MNRKQKNYSVAETVQYHKDRLKSDKMTENQKAYSRHWLDGFNDEHAKNNLPATEDEYKQKKAYLNNLEKDLNNQKMAIKKSKSVNRLIFGGYINGLKAKLKRK